MHGGYSEETAPGDEGRGCNKNNNKHERERERMNSSMSCSGDHLCLDELPGHAVNPSNAGVGDLVEGGRGKVESFAVATAAAISDGDIDRLSLVYNSGWSKSD